MATPAQEPLGYDPFSQEVMADPLPFYARLRREVPVVYLDKYDTFAFTRFQDIVDLLTTGNNTFIASETTLPTPAALQQHNHGKVSEWPLDPMPIGALLGSPHYEVLRHAHIRPFRLGEVLKLESFMREQANLLLDELLPKRRFDLTQDFGGIFAARTICRLLDMDLAQAAEVLRLVNQCSMTDPETGGADVGSIIARCVEMISAAVTRRRKAGADGSVQAIDGLINLAYYGRPLTDAEIATQLTCIFIGGVETVPKIAAHGLMELANAPDQLAAVQADLDRYGPIAVEEMIRFCAPAQWFARTVHKDVTIGGQELKVGQRVMVLFGSAARDEAEFDEPEKFVWNRKIERVLSFGLGQHYCIGLHLARLELRVLVDVFLRRVQHYSFDMEHAVRLPSSFQWGWNSLPVLIG